MNEFYKRDDEIALSEKIDNDTVVINLSNGCYYNFNATASFIWDLVGCGLNRIGIIEQYALLYNINTEKASMDVSTILNTLVTDGLVVTSSEKPITPESLPEPPPYLIPFIEKFDDMQEMLLLDPIHEVTEKGWPYKSD